MSSTSSEEEAPKTKKLKYGPVKKNPVKKVRRSKEKTRHLPSTDEDIETGHPPTYNFTTKTESGRKITKKK